MHTKQVAIAYYLCVCIYTKLDASLAKHIRKVCSNYMCIMYFYMLIRKFDACRNCEMLL
jgi:hypothetical protein